MIHNLKIHAVPFADLVSGAKTAEVRTCADRDFQVGDLVELFLVDESGGNATQSIVREITHVQKGYGLPEDLCVLSYSNSESVNAPRDLLERCERELSIGIGPAPKNRAQELRTMLDAKQLKKMCDCNQGRLPCTCRVIT